MLGAMQPANTVNADFVRARPFDPRAHFVEQDGQVLNFGLARGVLQYSNTLRHAGGHHQVFRAGHGNRVKAE